MASAKFKQKEKSLEDDPTYCQGERVVKEIVEVRYNEVYMMYHLESGKVDTEIKDFDAFVRCEDRDDVINFMKVNESYERI